MLLICLFFIWKVQAADMKVFHLIVKDGQFSPQSLNIPKDEKIKLEVLNAGASAEEFESMELNREKIVPAGQMIALFLGPLEVGEYHFFGDFHKDTAQGVLVVK